MHVAADARVECAERLVEQQDARAPHQRLRDREPLLHAARELGRILVAGIRETDRREHVERALPRLAARLAEQPRGQRRARELLADHHVLERRHVREHRVLLKHDAAVRPRLIRQRLAVEQHLAARRPLLAEQDPQERGLAAARRADDRDELAGLDVQADVLEHDLTAVLLPKPAHLQRAHRAAPAPYHGNTTRLISRSARSSANASSVIHATYGRMTSMSRKRRTRKIR